MTGRQSSATTKALRLIDKGATVHNAARKAGVSPSTVYRAGGAEARQRFRIQKYERDRREAIIGFCEYGRVDQRVRDAWINGNASIEQVANELLDLLADRSKKDVPVITSPLPTS